MILTESGLRFRRGAGHWRCVEYPDLVMLPGPERYSVGEQEFAALSEALAKFSVGGLPQYCWGAGSCNLHPTAFGP